MDVLDSRSVSLGIPLPMNIARQFSHVWFVLTLWLVVTTVASAQVPTITSHPANQMVVEGQNASFSVTATGAPTLTYQWRRNNVDIGGATTATYILVNAQLSHTGSEIDVVVRNGAGMAT